MKSWDDMTALEQAQVTFWDMYKDAHGVRPRGIDTSKWTLDDFQLEFSYLEKCIDENERQREHAEARAAQVVEARIADLIAIGAGDRASAIRWLHDAENTDGDDEFLCYSLGLPYGYFKKEMA